ncbi:hypothetical protein IJF85_02100 [Candidatus Saccharibacteria bacterium]|nr:hypothetical protein [Candidatus Saccharibacteria bacterium]
MVKAKDPSAKVILPTPVGETWNQGLAREFAGVAGGVAKGPSGAGDRRYSIEDRKLGRAASSVSEMEHFGQDPRLNENYATGPAPTTHYIILCPHYEGYDERILTLVDYKVSLGKFVLTGGELPALVIIDSIVRLIPGVLGGETSAEIESFSDGDNLEYPQYTKPYDFRGMTVPDILLSGNHGEIAKWRAEHSGTAK